MNWKYTAATSHTPSPMATDPSVPTSPDAPPLNDFSFSIELLDIYTLETVVGVACSGEDLPIEALVKNGYLANVPSRPTLAISFRTLELFRRIRLRKSSFSVEAFAKVICDLYSVSPRSRRSPLAPTDLFVSRCRIAGATVLCLLTHLKSTFYFYDPSRRL